MFVSAVNSVAGDSPGMRQRNGKQSELSFASHQLITEDSVDTDDASDAETVPADSPVLSKTRMPSPVFKASTSSKTASSKLPTSRSRKSTRAGSRPAVRDRIAVGFACTQALSIAYTTQALEAALSDGEADETGPVSPQESSKFRKR